MQKIPHLHLDVRQAGMMPRSAPLMKTDVRFLENVPLARHRYVSLCVPTIVQRCITARHIKSLPGLRSKEP